MTRRAGLVSSTRQRGTHARANRGSLRLPGWPRSLRLQSSRTKARLARGAAWKPAQPAPLRRMRQRMRWPVIQMSAERAPDGGKRTAFAAAFAHQIDNTVGAKCHAFALALLERLEVESAWLNVFPPYEIGIWIEEQFRIRSQRDPIAIWRCRSARYPREWELRHLLQFADSGPARRRHAVEGGCTGIFLRHQKQLPAGRHKE